MAKEKQIAVVKAKQKNKIEYANKSVLALKVFQYMLLSTILLSLIGFSFQVDYIFIIGTVVIGLILTLPIAIAINKKNYEYFRFQNLSAYMEHLVLNYSDAPTVVFAMTESAKVLTDKKLKDLVIDACKMIKEGNASDEEGTYTKAFKSIEKYYSCEILKQIHRTLEQLEFSDVDSSFSLSMALSEVHNWNERMRTNSSVIEGKMKRSIKILLISFLAAIGITWILPFYAIEFKDTLTYQITTTAFTVASNIVFALLHMGCSKPLINDYNPKKKKLINVKNQIRVAFPEWLRSVVLQVPVSGAKNSIILSYKTAPEVLKEEIKTMIGKIRTDDTSTSYIEFLQKYKISEISNAMQTYYTLINCCEKDVLQQQTNSVLNQNSLLLDDAWNIRNKHSFKKLSLLSELPAYFASVSIAAVTVLTAFMYIKDVIKL